MMMMEKDRTRAVVAKAARTTTRSTARRATIGGVVDDAAIGPLVAWRRRSHRANGGGRMMADRICVSLLRSAQGWIPFRNDGLPCARLVGQLLAYLGR
jgi:hypothetical protein